MLNGNTLDSFASKTIVFIIECTWQITLNLHVKSTIIRLVCLLCCAMIFEAIKSRMRDCEFQLNGPKEKKMTQ